MSLIDAWGWEQMCQEEKPKPKKKKCIKKMNCGYSFYVKCYCGTELNINSYYWSDFKLCPNCGEKIIEVDE